MRRREFGRRVLEASALLGLRAVSAAKIGTLAACADGRLTARARH